MLRLLAIGHEVAGKLRDRPLHQVPSFVGRVQNHRVPQLRHADFALAKPALLGQSNRLRTAVIKELCLGHGAKSPVGIYLGILQSAHGHGQMSRRAVPKPTTRARACDCASFHLPPRTPSRYYPPGGSEVVTETNEEIGRVGAMFSSYQTDGLFDEMFEATAKPRPHYTALAARFAALDDAALAKRRRMADVTFRNQGITFTVYKDAAGVEKIFPFDLVPRILPAAEWEHIERGLIQRITALNLFCQDIYHDQRILQERVIPPELIYGAKMFRREMFHVSVPRNIYIHICGTDLIRDKAGTYFVLEDNGRTPSGVSYVLENRSVMKRVFPTLFGAYRVRAIEDYPYNLLQLLRHIAPNRSENPAIAVLSPGTYNSAYFEHSFVARQMGVELVEGRDLIDDNAHVYM